MKTLLRVTLLLSLAACPKLPEPDDCTPNSHRCDDAGYPQVCSPGQRWTNVTEQPCTELEATCCLTAIPNSDAGLTHACVPENLCIPFPGFDGGTP